ncbi:MAG TPA: amino acid adenylation domain-containing protein [Allosphingosinicella sp.]|jgi:non-ribosomal peptide synthetase-like protein|nr:amino acid adenylation domain-containing protein [Allosphingosinicella sp.]
MGREDPGFWSAERAGARAPSLLHDFLAAPARAAPESIAIDIPPGRHRPERQLLSYGALEALSERLALHLAPLLASEAIVPLLLPRTSPLLHVAQIAVLKAGGAFTSLDPNFPAERMREIVADAEAPILLADADGVSRLRPLAGEERQVFDVASLLDTPPAADALPRDIGPDRLAYVIYTSGTTGRPKGVMVEHGSIANLIRSDLDEFGLTPADRVVQGSSAAYDSFLEETWLAFSAGATLLVMDDETARLGPDLVPWLQREHATVFCPPPTLLRSTGCSNPAEALPDLRLLYVGGEALPSDIADLWSQGLRLVNGYGPTECAVTCLRGDVRAGEPVTIGKPVPGMEAWVLDAHLAEVPDGGRGELCLGGVGVARGYRHRPEITAEKFIDHPVHGRLYRTGDLVRRDAEGDFHYHGRIDAQVKIRGHRVELAEIEARLAALPGVRAAAARLQDGGADELVAWIVPDDADAPPQAEALKTALAAVLPRHMIPRQIGTLEALPTTVGGKLDRAALPTLALTASAPAGRSRAPATPLERQLAEAMADILKRPDNISVDDDFFEDLGGDSLSAAMVVTLLRDESATEWITVSDVYDARTVRKLAELGMTRSDAAGTPAPVLHREGRPRPILTATVQLGCLAAELLAGSWITWLVGFRLLPPLFDALGMTGSILSLPLLALAGMGVYLPLSVAFAMLVKRLVIGRYRPIRAPVGSAMYIRHWVTVQAARLIPWPLIAGTSFHQVALRALGAKIGRRVHIHRGVNLGRGGWDLLEIGDDVSIGQDAQLGLVELDRGDIVVGPITIGAGASLRVRASVQGHCRVGEGSELAPLSVLDAGNSIPAGERWDGVPAAPAGLAAPPPPAHSHALAPWLHGLLTMLAESVAAYFVLIPAQLLTLAVCLTGDISIDALWRWLYRPVFDLRTVAVIIGLTAAAAPLTLVAQALVMRALGRVREGTIGRWSLAYIRVWLKTGILFAAGRWLSGTMFWPMWLRLAGMRIGAKCEISTIIDVVPELVSIGGETFFADGIYLGGPIVTRGTVTLGPVALGRNTFLGNHAVIPPGERLPDDILIGIATVADSHQIEAGHSRFGHPSFDLPRREVVEADRSVTHDPSPIRFANRMFWELLRFTLPVPPLLLTALWYGMVAAGERSAGPAAFVFLVLPAATLLPVAALCLAILLLKWGLIGRVRPGQHALWSCWCSRWDFLFVAWARWAALTLQQLEGTFLLTAYLRLMGLKIGRGAVLGPEFAQVVDPDMIEIGAGATVSAMFQAHTFEDRVLKVDKVRIGAGATVSAGTVPLYGAVVGEGAHVGAHSVIMKQEHLLPGLRYQGVPTRVFGREAG